jgi:hypothetical protein
MAVSEGHIRIVWARGTFFATQKVEEACVIAQREVNARAEDDPELRVALEQLANALEANGRQEAIQHLQRKLALDRSSLSPEDPLPILAAFHNSFAGSGTSTK